MGVGAVSDGEQPLFVKSPTLGWGLHLGMGWRAAVGSGQPSWHTATDSTCILQVGQLPAVLDVVAAIRAGTSPLSAIDAALSGTSAGPWWSDTVTEASATVGPNPVRSEMVRVLGRLLR